MNFDDEGLLVHHEYSCRIQKLNFMWLNHSFVAYNLSWEQTLTKFIAHEQLARNTELCKEEIIQIRKILHMK